MISYKRYKKNVFQNYEFIQQLVDKLLLHPSDNTYIQLISPSPMDKVPWLKWEWEDSNI